MQRYIFENDAVRMLQTYLRHLSYHDGSLPAVPIDGIFDSATRSALSEYQRTRALPVTGSADRETFDRLRDEYLESLAKRSPPEAVELFPRAPEDFAIREGDGGFLASAVIYMLGELSALYGFGEEIFTSRVFDGAVAEALREFQKKNFLFPSGAVDRATWDALAAQHNYLLYKGQ